MNFPSRHKIQIYSRAFQGLFKTAAEIQELYKKVQTMIHLHEHFFFQNDTFVQKTMQTEAETYLVLGKNNHDPAKNLNEVQKQVHRMP